MKFSRVHLLGGITSALLCGLVALWAYTDARAQQKRQESEVSAAWEQGYWIGASNGVAAAQQQVQIAKKGAPPNAEVFRQQLLSGLTNNPYRN